MYRSQETVKNNANPPTTTDASDDLLMQYNSFPFPVEKEELASLEYPAK